MGINVCDEAKKHANQQTISPKLMNSYGKSFLIYFFEKLATFLCTVHTHRIFHWHLNIAVKSKAKAKNIQKQNQMIQKSRNSCSWIVDQWAPEHWTLFNRKNCVRWLCVWCRISLASVSFASVFLAIFLFDRLDSNTHNNNQQVYSIVLFFFSLSFPFNFYSQSIPHLSHFSYLSIESASLNGNTEHRIQTNIIIIIIRSPDSKNYSALEPSIQSNTKLIYTLLKSILLPFFDRISNELNP